MSSLFVVYLGGAPAPGRAGEDHEIVLVVAENAAEARVAALRKWTGHGRPHADSTIRVSKVDGHRVELRRTERPGDRLLVDE